MAGQLGRARPHYTHADLPSRAPGSISRPVRARTWHSVECISCTPRAEETAGAKTRLRRLLPRALTTSTLDLSQLCTRFKGDKLRAGRRASFHIGRVGSQLESFRADIAMMRSADKEGLAPYLYQAIPSLQIFCNVGELLRRFTSQSQSPHPFPGLRSKSCSNKHTRAPSVLNLKDQLTFFVKADGDLDLFRHIERLLKRSARVLPDAGRDRGALVRTFPPSRAKLIKAHAV